MDDLWIALAAIIVPFLLLGVFFWLRYKARNDMQQTIRLALDKGQELSPELIDRLGHPRVSKNRDLRLGVIWLGIAVALALFSQVIPDEEAPRILLGVAAFPLCIGAAYLLIWRFAGSD